VILLSLGGLFEFYDLFLTAYLSPGLEAAGIFHKGARGLMGLSDQATFAAATFTGLFIGTLVFAPFADRLGRRSVFTVSMLWYSLCTLVMACQSDAASLDLWRCLAGIGIGAELVTIDSYLVELVPAPMRGRVFAVNQAIQFSAVPIVGVVCSALIPLNLWGIPGWRLVVALGASGALAVWWLRRRIPESPRWLAAKDRTDQPKSSLAVIFRTPYGAVTLMLAIFNFFQTVGFYGFGNWVPKLLEASGTDVLHSLRYSVAIAIAYPVGPLLCTLIADRFERKWQIVAAAMGTASFGLLFITQTSAFMLIGLGVSITLSNNLLSYAYHAYQAELYPAAIRARAVGFVYSWSRLSTVFTSLMIGFFLDRFGKTGVFGFIAGSMMIVCIAIGGFGPRTRDLVID
jgi:putative MFS transporter